MTSLTKTACKCQGVKWTNPRSYGELLSTFVSIFDCFPEIVNKFTPEVDLW